MQGASREALAQAWADVEALTSSVDGVAATQLGEQLFAVVSVIDGQAGLRRALSDPSLEPGRKAELAKSLFAGKIGEAALNVVSGVVRSRWSRMRDLTDSLETLGVLALLVASEKAGQADDVEDELFRFSRIVESNAALRAALADAGLPDDNKVSLVRQLLGERVTATTLALVLQLVTHPRGRTPEDGLTEYGQVAARRKQRLVARVTTAVVLSDAERERLRAALANLYGHEVHLQAEVDPELVGGIVVQVGDEVIDGSVISRLAEARQALR